MPKILEAMKDVAVINREINQKDIEAADNKMFKKLKTKDAVKINMKMNQNSVFLLFNRLDDTKEKGKRRKERR